MGRPKQPLALALVKGADKKDPGRYKDRKKAEPGKPLGNPPSTLNADEKKIWREIVKNCVDGVFKGGDRIALEMACKLLHEFRTDYAEMQAGRIAKLQTLLSLFGMTPADRDKVVVADKHDTSDPWEDL